MDDEQEVDVKEAFLISEPNHSSPDVLPFGGTEGLASSCSLYLPLARLMTIRCIKGVLRGWETRLLSFFSPDKANLH
jgi:hypothetical protein